MSAPTQTEKRRGVFGGVDAGRRRTCCWTAARTGAVMVMLAFLGWLQAFAVPPDVRLPALVFALTQRCASRLEWTPRLARTLCLSRSTQTRPHSIVS